MRPRLTTGLPLSQRTRMRLQAHHTPPSGRVYHSNGLSWRLLALLADNELLRTPFSGSPTSENSSSTTFTADDLLEAFCPQLTFYLVPLVEGCLSLSSGHPGVG